MGKDPAYVGYDRDNVYVEIVCWLVLGFPCRAAHSPAIIYNPLYVGYSRYGQV